MGMPQDSVEYM